MGLRILVTRPQPGGDRTGRAIAAGGHEALILPLGQTRAVAPSPRLMHASYDAVAVTSGAALRHAPAEWIAALANRKCYAVGAASAEAARAAGFETVAKGDGDALSLAGRIAGELTMGARVLHLAGKVRTHGLEETLTRSGIAVAVAEVYDILALEYADQALLDRIGDRPVDAALVYSARSGVALAEIMTRKSLAGLFERTALLCISKRAAGAFDAERSAQVRISDQASEEALLSLIDAL